MFCEDISFFAFPLNGIAAIILLLGIWVLHTYYANRGITRFLSGVKGTLIVTVALVTLLLVEGTWAWGLFKTWPFLLLLLLLLVMLGLVGLKHARVRSLHDGLFMLNHAGLWLALFAALFGAPDRVSCKMIAPLHEAEYNGILPDRTLYPLPFTVTLEKFEIEHYTLNDRQGAPKRFLSTLLLDNREERRHVTVEVNKPTSYHGYSIYQDGYDQTPDADARYVTLLIVKDPWIGLVYTGIFMLIAGAIGLIIHGPLRKKEIP